MSTKLVDNKRRNHAEKILKNASKKVSVSAPKSISAAGKQVGRKIDPSLKDQYDLIRQDLIKLRDDLATGYDMAKNLIDKKSLVKQLLATK